MKGSGEGVGRVRLDQYGTETRKLRQGCEVEGRFHLGVFLSRMLPEASLQMTLLYDSAYP